MGHKMASGYTSSEINLSFTISLWFVSSGYGTICRPGLKCGSNLYIETRVAFAALSLSSRDTFVGEMHYARMPYI